MAAPELYSDRIVVDESLDIFQEIPLFKSFEGFRDFDIGPNAGWETSRVFQYDFPRFGVRTIYS